MSSLRYPIYASLLVDDARYDALEFSAAGMSLTRSVLESVGLDHLRRGDECETVLCVGGAGWEEQYDVVLRLAALGDTIVGFAFVGLPPLARIMLERHDEGAESWDEDESDDAFVGATAPFAFARLAEPDETSRRFILDISEFVFALTQGRKVSPPSETIAKSAPSRPKRTASKSAATTPAGTVLVYAVAVLALLCILVMMAFG